MPSPKNMINYIDKIKVTKTGQDLVTEVMEKAQAIKPEEILSGGYDKPTTWDVLDGADTPKKTQNVTVTPKGQKPKEPVVSDLLLGASADQPVPIVQQPDKPDRISKNYVVSMLRKYEEEKMAERGSYKKKTINAYDLTGCIRKLFYALKNIDEKPPDYAYPYGEIVHGIGNAVHEIIQKRLPSKNNELKIKVEQGFEFVINMRSDILWNDNVVVEIKTIESIPKEAKKEHILQALFYAYFLNRHFNHNITLVQLLYVSRGKVDVEVFDVEITEDLLNRVDLRIKEIVHTVALHLKEDIAPSMDNPHVNTENCRFCGYAHVCQTRSKYKSI